MSALSDYLEQALLNHCLRNSAYTSPTTVYVALYLSSPGDDDSGTEVSGGGYARQPVAFQSPVVSGIGYVCKNSADITFPEAVSANWGTVSHFAVVDDGHLLWHGALDVPKVVEIGDQLVFKAGELKVGLQ